MAELKATIGDDELPYWFALDEIEKAWENGEDPRDDWEEELDENEIAENVKATFAAMAGSSIWAPAK